MSDTIAGQVMAMACDAAGEDVSGRYGATIMDALDAYADAVAGQDVDLSGKTIAEAVGAVAALAGGGSGGQGGGGASGGASEGDVNFWDYDGTLVASYSAQQFAALAEMPANPSHEGLDAQGWNWSLADAKAYVARHGMLEVGQVYATSDGKTHIRVEVEDRALPVQLCFFQSVADGATVDWGDGSDAETSSTCEQRGYEARNSSEYAQFSHAYEAEGVYDATIEVSEGCVIWFGDGGWYGYYGIGGQEESSGRNSTRTNISATAIAGVHFGEGVVALKAYALSETGVRYVTVPHGVAFPVTNSDDSDEGAFRYCRQLKFLTIPDGTASLTARLLYGAYSLERVSLPNGVRFLGDNGPDLGYDVFNGCTSLESATLPDSVKGRGQQMFYNCTSLRRVSIPANAGFSVGALMFYQCQILGSVDIPEEVAGIDSNAFQCCYLLRSAVVPAGVATIGNSLFDSCSSLKYVVLLPETPPSLSGEIFNYDSYSLRIYVPDASVDAYKSASYWSNEADYIFPLSECPLYRASE